MIHKPRMVEASRLQQQNARSQGNRLIIERFVSMFCEHPRIMAVIPSFNPDGRLVASCVQLMIQVARIVIVDDGSNEEQTSLVLDQCQLLGCTVIRRKSNNGIACALNVGVEVCRQDAADFVLTLDQDSFVPDNYVRLMLDAWHNATQDSASIGAIGPERINSHLVRSKTRKKKLAIGGEPIQSGLFFPTKTLDTVGPFNELFFIDCVDTEYFLRMKDHGLCVALAQGSVLRHQLGVASPAKLFGVQVVRRGRLLELGHSAPFRYYYIRRNRTHLYLKYGLRYPGWALRSIREETRHHILVLIFLPNRYIHIRICLKGFFDGLRGATGPISASASKLADQ